MTTRRSDSRPVGQTLVLFALALVALIGMSALIVDGGNAFVQQRGTQNGADAASGAGATVLAQGLMSVASGGGNRTDADVLAAMNASATVNNIRPFNPGVAGNSKAWYTDISGNLLTSAGFVAPDTSTAVQVGTGAIPDCRTNCVGTKAAGVQAAGQRTFSTLIAGAIGINSFDATAPATSVTGYGPSICDAAQGCALLPIAFGTNQNTCSSTGTHAYNATEWLAGQATWLPYTSSNEALLSTCKDGEGAFGWLDYGCAPTTAEQISQPCNVLIYFPTWWVGQSGNVNGVEDELNSYAGNVVGTYEPGLDQEVLIPFFDGICNEDRPGIEPPNPPGDEAPVFGTPPFPGVCANNPSGGGANRHYHLLFFIGFVLDHAYVQGDNSTICNTPPGSPLTGPTIGSTGCIKGWFARVVGAPGPVSGNPGLAGNATPLSITLIK